MQDQELTFVAQIDGKQVTCTVLFTFYSEQTDTNYMLYTPDDPAGDGQVQVVAARFDPSDPSAVYPLRDETDRAIVQSFIEYVSSHDPSEMKQELERLEQDDGIHTVEELPS